MHMQVARELFEKLKRRWDSTFEVSYSFALTLFKSEGKHFDKENMNSMSIIVTCNATLANCPDAGGLVLPEMRNQTLMLILRPGDASCYITFS